MTLREYLDINSDVQAEMNEAICLKMRITFSHMVDEIQSAINGGSCLDETIESPKLSVTIKKILEYAK